MAIEWGAWSRKSLDFLAVPLSQRPRITILEGSVRSSKTVTMIPEWLRYIKAGPRGRLAMTGYTKDTLKRNVLDDIRHTVGNDAYSDPGYRNTGLIRIYDREIQCIGLKDEGSERYLRGGTYAGCYSDELTLMPQSSHNMLMTRLSVNGARFYGTTNPDSPYHWLYVEYITNQAMLDSGLVQVYHFDLDDNLNLSDEYKDSLRTMYSGLFYRRMILGQWVMAEGAIYDMFDEARHVVSINDIPDHYDEYIMGEDYGAGNPTVFILIGVTTRPDGSKDFWVLREWYHDPRKSGAKTAAQYKAALIEFMGDIQVKAHYPDPAALDFINEMKSGSCGRSIMNVRHARNEVLPGINTIATHLSQDRMHYVRETCPETLKEKVAYTWDEKAQKCGEDKPMKVNDHCMDAERYPIHTAYPATGKNLRYF